MATYATEAELAAYVAGTAYESRIPDEAPARERLLELAERDLDTAAFVVVPLNPDPALPKVDPAGDLDAEERPALSRACCAQAVYRVEMGDEHFVRAQRVRTTRLPLILEGKLPIVGPEAARELSAAGLFRLSTSVGGRREADRFQSS